jgi:hypothetical protein
MSGDGTNLSPQPPSTDEKCLTWVIVRSHSLTPSNSISPSDIPYLPETHQPRSKLPPPCTATSSCPSGESSLLPPPIPHPPSDPFLDASSSIHRYHKPTGKYLEPSSTDVTRAMCCPVWQHPRSRHEAVEWTRDMYPILCLVKQPTST